MTLLNKKWKIVMLIQMPDVFSNRQIDYDAISDCLGYDF